MVQYSAQVFSPCINGHWLPPIRPTIKSLQEYLQRSFDSGMMCDPDGVEEIVVLKGQGFGSMPKIHGYYDWVDGMLKLDKSKPVVIHNALYGLGG